MICISWINSNVNTFSKSRVYDSSFENKINTRNINIENIEKLSDINKVDQHSLIKFKDFTHISFKGDISKKLNQFAFLAPEDKAVGLNSTYALGGLGVVVQEAGDSWSKIGADVRKFIPYHSYNNKEGKIIVLTKDSSGNTSFKSVETDYKLKEGENFVVLQAPNGGKSDYKIIEDVHVEGKIKQINDKLEIEEIPYKIFKQAGTGESGKPIVYFVHLPDLAKFQAAYDVGSTTGSAYGGAYGGFSNSSDLKYAQLSRAFTDAIQKLDDNEHGNYNPANIWLHDRQAFPAIVNMSEESSKGNKYFNGLRTHSTFHNPGRNYQGFFENPIDFFRLVGSEKDLEILKQQPEYKFIKKMMKKNFSELSNADKTKLKMIFDPVIGTFKDSLGTYNICEIPIQSVRKNPFNYSLGTVSVNYGKEMKNPHMPEIALGLTEDLASSATIDIVNGSTPANMKTNEIGTFGRPGNGLNLDNIKNGYTPFEVKFNSTHTDVLNIDEIFEIKKKNTKWLTDTIAKATKEGTEALNKLFFNDEQLNPKSNKITPAKVLGGLSEYKEGDILHISWGRPDPQKGLPTLIESFLHFIKREDISIEEKLKTKLLVGAGGPNPWDPEAADWKDIQALMKEISEISDGLYKNNICYINGFFPNRLANACLSSDFTSVYEPCGITPLESFAAGNPVISNRTGGSPDFIKPYIKGKNITNETGFLTTHAFLVKPEVFDLDSKLTGTELNTARRKAISVEVSDCMKDFAEVLKDEAQFKQMMKNTLLEETDWHNNSRYNGGKSANQRYFNEVFNISDNYRIISERNELPLKNLKGDFNVVNSIGKNMRKKIIGNNRIIALSIGLFSVLAGIAGYLEYKEGTITKIKNKTFKKTA